LASLQFHHDRVQDGVDAFTGRFMSISTEP
jgi:hypothetical protein